MRDHPQDGRGALDRLRDEVASLDATSRIVQAADVRLHVLDYEGPGVVPALFLPGITSPAITWDFVVAQIRDLVRPYVLDLRGRGLSSSPSTGYSLAQYAEDVRAVVAQLGLERPLLVGHSLGARIAAAVAAHDADLAGGLVLVDPPLSGPGRAPYPTALASFLEQLRAAAAGCTGDDVRRFYPRWPAAELDLRARWLPTCAEPAIVETHRGFESESFFPLWRRLRGPLVAIYGAESSVVSRAGADELRETNAAAAMVSVPGAGHMVPWDAPDGFLAVLRRVLQLTTEAR